MDMRNNYVGQYHTRFMNYAFMLCPGTKTYRESTSPLIII